jgi:hypothetical protein
MEMGEFTFGWKLKFLVLFSFSLSTPKFFSSHLPEGRFSVSCVHTLTLTHVHIFVQQKLLLSYRLQFALQCSLFCFAFQCEYLLLNFRPHDPLSCPQQSFIGHLDSILGQFIQSIFSQNIYLGSITISTIPKTTFLFHPLGFINQIFKNLLSLPTHPSCPFQFLIYLITVIIFVEGQKL